MLSIVVSVTSTEDCAYSHWHEYMRRTWVERRSSRLDSWINMHECKQLSCFMCVWQWEFVCLLVPACGCVYERESLCVCLCLHVGCVYERESLCVCLCLHVGVCMRERVCVFACACMWGVCGCVYECVQMRTFSVCALLALCNLGLHIYLMSYGGYVIAGESLSVRP